MAKNITPLTLDLGPQSYPIYIGENLLSNPSCYAELKERRCAIVCDQTVADLYLDTVKTMVPKALTIIIPPGEEHKTFTTVENIATQLLQHYVGRNSMMIALGGGIVGDITGFAAGCYQRGIPFMQIPTTLLAQVDASVGGKTGVNHTLGKNMLGLFHQPRSVIIDLKTLQTLPAREIAAGLAEIIKYGIIADEAFFSWLEKHIEDLYALDGKALEHAVRRSCEIKAQIVALDELEKTGLRMLLNYGHTFGHAIETSLGHGTWLHGEAVGCGMVLAAKFSAQLGLIPAAVTDRITRLVERAKLPSSLPPEVNRDRMLELMQHDKKNLDNQQCLILVKAVGNAFVENKIKLSQVQHFLETL